MSLYLGADILKCMWPCPRFTLDRLNSILRSQVLVLLAYEVLFVWSYAMKILSMATSEYKKTAFYGQIPNIHVLQRLFGIYTLAVTSALPSTKQRRIKFLTSHATLFPVRVRQGRNKLYNEGILSFSLPLPNIHTHLSTWKNKKKNMKIWFLFSYSFCCAGIKPQGLIHDNQVHHHWAEAWP